MGCGSQSGRGIVRVSARLDCTHCQQPSGLSVCHVASPPVGWGPVFVSPLNRIGRRAVVRRGRAVGGDARPAFLFPPRQRGSLTGHTPRGQHTPPPPLVVERVFSGTSVAPWICTLSAQVCAASLHGASRVSLLAAGAPGACPCDVPPPQRSPLPLTAVSLATRVPVPRRPP